MTNFILILVFSKIVTN